MPRLNYHHLRYFWAVATDGSLTRAARRLNLSQSAMSVQIGKLEAQVGTSLFDRLGKRLVLTEAGHLAFDYAQTIFVTGDELLSALRGQPRNRRNVLRVGALPTLSRNFQLEFLRPLLGREDTELIVRSGTLRELLPELGAHGLDVVLANAPVRRDTRTPLQSRRLAEQPVSLVGRPRRGRRPFRFPEDLRKYPVLLPSLDSEIRVEFDRLVALANIHPLIQAEVDDMAMLRLLARESDGVTLVPPIVVRDELDAGILVEYHRLVDLTESFYAITATRRYQNPLLAELVARSSQLV